VCLCLCEKVRARERETHTHTERETDRQTDREKGKGRDEGEGGALVCARVIGRECVCERERVCTYLAQTTRADVASLSRSCDRARCTDSR